MEKFYTVSSDPKRLDGADNYGNVTDSVFFEGETETVLWKHAPTTEVAKGTKVYGEITNETSKAGKPWRKFSKRQVPEDNQDVETAGDPSSSKTNAKSSYNPDGARQGMAINNGAKYVIESAVRDNITLDPKELAEEITRYAKEIYNIDLEVNVAKTDDELLDEFLG